MPGSVDRGGRGGRLGTAAVVGAAGLAGTVYGLAVGVVPAAVRGISPDDAVAIAAAGAGLILLALAFRIALRGRRRRVQLLVVPVVLAILQWAIMPAVGAGLITSAPHPAVAPARTLGLAGARDVAFRAADGVRLAGWYVPGANGATVILLHGSHGTRADTADHLRMLHRAGYTVLALDARGHGASAGQTNALGWRGEEDVAGAVRFLRARADVDPRRIGALGLSMGAEEALRAAAEGVPLRAVIADGAGASTNGDRHLVARGPLAPVADSVAWLTMREAELISGDPEPTPLRDIVARIHVPVLLIASRASGERRVDQAFQHLIGHGARLWYVPDTGHTAALHTHPAAYATRVTAFLRAALPAQ